MKGEKRPRTVALCESLRLRRTLSGIGKELPRKFDSNVLGLGLIGSFSKFSPVVDPGTKKVKSDVDYIIYTEKRISEAEAERIQKFVDKRLRQAGFWPCPGMPFIPGRTPPMHRDVNSIHYDIEMLEKGFDIDSTKKLVDALSVPFFGNKPRFNIFREYVVDQMERNPEVRRIIEKKCEQRFKDSNESRIGRGFSPRQKPPTIPYGMPWLKRKGQAKPR